MNTTKDKGNSRKYFMIFIAMLIQAIPFGIAQNIQPLFIPYVIKQFSFSLAAFSLIFTIGSLASAVCSPFLGKLFGKINIKVIFMIGTAMSSLGFLGMGLASNLPEFYILSAVAQIGCVLFSGLGTPFLIGSWFPSKGRGKALGIAFAGGSIGNIFLQPMVSEMLGGHGPSYAYMFFGIISLIVSLVIVLLFIRTPKEGEVLVVTEQSAKEEVTEEHHVVYDGPGARGTRKEKYFWVLGIGYVFIGAAISACSTQYASYFKMQLHLNAGLIGILGSVFAFFCLVGNVGGGALFDKIGTFKSMGLAFILQALAIIGMLFAKVSPECAFMFSVFYGLCVFSYMSGPAFIATDVFGRKDSSVNLGVISLFFAAGFALGSVIFGAVAGAGGFGFAWIIMLVLLIIGYILLLFSVKEMKHKQSVIMKHLN
ncbi:MAG: conjugated bile salt MFS transporter [Clostridium sp.]